VRAWSGRALLAAALITAGLWFVPACAPASRVDAKTITVTIDGIAFGAPDGEIHVGDTVKWTNKDAVDHTATEKSKAWRVELEAGKSGTLVMTKAGTFDYFCEYHPNMTATLAVK